MFLNKQLLSKKSGPAVCLVGALAVFWIFILTSVKNGIFYRRYIFLSLLVFALVSVVSLLMTNQGIVSDIRKKTLDIPKLLLAFVEEHYWILFILLLGAAFLFCFYKLDVAYVDSWDEARHGVNAYEMYSSKSYIVNTYNYTPDYWNLKPPLSYWCIAAAFHMFGPSVFSLRIYSALAYFLTVVIVGLFVKRYGKVSSLLSVCFMISSILVFKNHMARAGDADALYCLFFTIAMIAMIKIPERQTNLYICGLSFAMAFLAKSWHAFIIVAIGGLFLLFTQEIKKISLKRWLLFIGSFVIPIGVWALLRYLNDGTAFFSEMLTADLLNRTSTGIEGHAYPLDFYFTTIFDLETPHVGILFICGAGCLLYDYVFSRKYFRDIIGYLLWCLLPFTLFSLASTKLIWYIFPVFVPLFIAASVFIEKYLRSNRVQIKTKVLVIIFVTMFIANYMSSTFAVIESKQGDAFQDFIKASGQELQLDAKQNAYIFVNGDNPEDPSGWSQNALFLAEAYGDYICRPGGADSFATEADNGILFISAEYYGERYDQLSEFPVLYQSDQFLLLTKG